MASPAEVMVSPIAGQSLPYDPQKDLAPVALAGETPLVIVAFPQVAPKGLQDLIARAKARVGQGGAVAQGVEKMKKGIELRHRKM